LIPYIITPVIIVREIFAEEIGEEKNTQENKNDKKFDEDDDPYFPAP
jgi:hypothetical protein